MSQNAFTLKQISEWQLKPEQSNVELPSIQRGFVWRPKQVEDLWDSILRGYPIGSFLFSRTGEKLFLMDGQQRATSIFLGQFNPYNPSFETKAWSIKGELPVVWIDLKPIQKPFSNKYLIRLTTRSHPWGYQSHYNNEKLTVSDRRNALKHFTKHQDNQGGYTTFKNTTTFPYDASYPLPLSFFFESNNSIQVLEKARLYLPEYFQTKHGGFSNIAEYTDLLINELSTEIEIILQAVREAQKATIQSTIIENTVLNEENETEDPTLFVRINSAGTALTGDDLIYSIYKASFPEAKNAIESIGISFTSAPQILSLVSRLVASQFDNHRFVRKFNVREFQKRLKNDEFKNNLLTLIQNGKLAQLFNNAINILCCKDNSLVIEPIPAVIIKQFIRKNPDLFLFFVYWIHLNDESKADDRTRLKMVAKLLTFAWFEFRNIPKLWNEMVTNADFWNQPLNELIWWNGSDGIQFLIKPKLLTAYYKQIDLVELFKIGHADRWVLIQNDIGESIRRYFNKVKGVDLDTEKANEYFWRFIGKIQYNKELILFAQREYINSTFTDFNQMEDVEDTNTPWDWDHLYPSEWVYRKVGCNKSIRDWNNTNGNLRAISLEHNRSRSNSQAPRDISDTTERQNSFINENDWASWKEIGGRIHDDQIDHYLQAITTRMLNIYSKFWKDLKIDELIYVNTEEV